LHTYCDLLFLIVSGFSSRLDYSSLPPVPDKAIKEYLLGPMNDFLKTNEKCPLFDEELASWFVSQFGGNFTDMKRFISNVLVSKKIGKEKFFSDNMRKYNNLFRVGWRIPGARVILDDLLKNGTYPSANTYDPDAEEYLIQKNIVALHSGGYTWNKRLVRTAYEDFLQKQQGYMSRFYGKLRGLFYTKNMTQDSTEDESTD
jgi:hypothetical protein